MIDTDKYEGCQTDSLVLHKGYLCPTIFMDVDGSGKNVPTLGRGIVDVQADIPEHYLQLLADAPLLLEAYKQLREDYEKMSEVLRQYGMDICRHCRVIYRDDDMNHPHYPSLHPWHMDGMCMKEMIE